MRVDVVAGTAISGRTYLLQSLLGQSEARHVVPFHVGLLCDDSAADLHGLTFVHSSAQRERFLWNRVYVQGLLGGCLGDVRGDKGILRGV